MSVKLSQDFGVTLYDAMLISLHETEKKYRPNPIPSDVLQKMEDKVLEDIETRPKNSDFWHKGFMGQLKAIHFYKRCHNIK